MLVGRADKTAACIDETGPTEMNSVGPAVDYAVRRLPVVSTTTHTTADRTGDGQDRADHQQDDAQPRQDRDTGDQADDKQDDSEDDHYCLRWNAGMCLRPSTTPTGVVQERSTATTGGCSPETTARRACDSTCHCGVYRVDTVSL